MLGQVLKADAANLGARALLAGGLVATPGPEIFGVGATEADLAVASNPTVEAFATESHKRPIPGTPEYDSWDIFRVDHSRLQVIHPLFDNSYGRERFFMYTRKDYDTVVKEAVATTGARLLYQDIGNVYANMAGMFVSLASFFDSGYYEDVREIVPSPGLYEKAVWVKKLFETVDENPWLKDAMDMAVINGAGKARFNDEQQVRRGLSVFFSTLEFMSLTAIRSSLDFPNEDSI